MNGFAAALALLQGILRTATQPLVYGIAIWFLAGLFAWSGVAKLRRPALAAMAVVDFGVVRRVYPRLGSALGATEVFLAVVLVLEVLPQLFLWVTALLLWCFVLLITRSLWSGKRFACFCFGDADSPLSAWTLGRTTGLALLATTLAVAARSSGMDRRWDEADALQVVTAAALLGALTLVGYVPRLLHWNRDWLQAHTGSRTRGT
jgi:hypothetical protein